MVSSRKKLRNLRDKLLVIFAVLLLISCEDKECEDLAQRLESLKCDKDECLVDLRELFNEDWNELYFFQGFNTPADITHVIGFEYRLSLIHISEPTRPY